ncbi:AAA family ATPase [Geitlerinema sp. PCC 9228]|uniref:AAA family ATPase n=1 Tax=Geitlerinema sp. PCC 9228 TaxID=111611 RepID=UPI0008F9B9B7|nr:AAA family ATPase [Geitlerinema sp. PCC 9228]
MKLVSIQLCNFRQFYGKTPPIYFAVSPHQNTTILHGNNGAGKTTLLNAFTWVLYEKLSGDLEFPDQLVNKRALAEGKPRKPIECWVALEFEHDSNRYQAKRAFRAYKNPQSDRPEVGKSDLFLQVAGDDGKWLIPTQHPEDILGRILPSSLVPYFFFNGERIEKIVRYDNKSEMAEATKTLLGIEVVNRSIRHLFEVKKLLENELVAIGDTQTKTLLEEKKRLETEKEELSQRQNEVIQELEHQEEIRKTISDRLLQLSGSEELQQLRQQLETQKKELQKQLSNAYDQLKKTIATQGYAVFLSDSIQEFRQLIERLRKKGELPTGIKQQFVKDLLQQSRCICGKDLDSDNEARQQVESWMDRAGSADIEESIIRIRAKIEDIDNLVPVFWNTVDRLQGDIHDYREKISHLETELDTISEKLREYPVEAVQNLQKRLDDTNNKIRELTLEQGSNTQQLEHLTEQLVTLERDIAKHKSKEVKQALTQRRIASTQEAADRMQQMRNRLDTNFRWQLQQRVQELFSQISFTPYIPKISEKYELTLVENTAGSEATVAASTGEHQILSLAFIGAIIDRVRDWSRRNTIMAPDSSTFPIVMDSPFGSLDEVYRRQIAKTLPTLANQLVILVTKTQWRGEVAAEIHPYLGKQYVLVYNSPKSDCEQDWIEVNGDRYPLVRESHNGFEYTEILEVD